jgi:hypothetical protein
MVSRPLIAVVLGFLGGNASLRYRLQHVSSMDILGQPTMCWLPNQPCILLDFVLTKAPTSVPYKMLHTCHSENQIRVEVLASKCFLFHICIVHGGVRF